MEAAKRTYELDGRCFQTLEQFFVVAVRLLAPDDADLLGHNLDSFNSFLHDVDDTLDEEYRLIWRQSETSRVAFGYPETVRQLHRKLAQCHPTNRSRVAEELHAAQSGCGPTVFDWLLEVFRCHDKIELILD